MFNTRQIIIHAFSELMNDGLCMLQCHSNSREGNTFSVLEQLSIETISRILRAQCYRHVCLVMCHAHSMCALLLTHARLLISPTHDVLCFVVNIWRTA